ncbi:dockerin type I repeat-containing protein [uncultured Ruminococcus sp.]|uniref:dockerin type I repeat-containing protein n=1 Tax=uncultured Ruminococcus sp. TaxID=165186 RepID=UPI0025F3B4AC|nr:dockerin type I repeat-containing protein [uncultured Ruminococcus sp.]
MRKFTKEISSLLAAVTVSATVNATYVSSEENIQLSGQMTMSDADYLEIPETAGVMVLPDEEPPIVGAEAPSDIVTKPPVTTTTIVGTSIAEPVTTTMPPLMGDVAPETTTTVTTLPPLAGTMTSPRMTTTTTSTTLPPFMGTMTAATTTTIVTTTTTSEEEIPPLMGEMAYIPGDANGDFEFNVADIITLQRYILHMPDAKIYDWYQADMCKDGEINIFDLVVMRRELLKQMRYDAERVFDK